MTQSRSDLSWKEMHAQMRLYAPEQPNTLRTWRLGLAERRIDELVGKEYSIDAYCEDLRQCRNRVTKTVEGWLEALGPDAMISDIEQRLTCSRCKANGLQGVIGSIVIRSHHGKS